EVVRGIEMRQDQLLERRVIGQALLPAVHAYREHSRFISIRRPRPPADAFAMSAAPERALRRRLQAVQMTVEAILGLAVRVNIFGAGIGVGNRTSEQVRQMGKALVCVDAV